MEEGKLLAKTPLLLVYKREVGLVCINGFTSFYRLQSVQTSFAAHKLLAKTKGEYHRNDIAYTSPLIHILECNHLSVIGLCIVKNSVCNSHIMVSIP